MTTKGEKIEPEKRMRVWNWEEHRMSPEEMKELGSRYKKGWYRVAIRPLKKPQEARLGENESPTE